jgi:hypothetical protein
MTCIHRTIVALILLSLPVPGFSQAGGSQDRSTVEASKKTFILSGTVGLAGVVMKGLPGSPVTDSRGCYSVQVEYGWTGTVTPTREGFAFVPAFKSYGEVTADQPKQDYVATAIAFTISGHTGLANVRIEGFPEEVITDEAGAYAATVPYGWSGRAVPAKAGYAFEPPSRAYPKVTRAFEREDYKSRLQTFTISDTMKAGSEPITDVLVTAEPGGQASLTDFQGRYAIQVPYGWTGRLIFSKRGFAFNPDDKRFTNVTEDIIGDELAPSGKRPAAPRSPAQSYPRAIVPPPVGHVFVIPTAQVAPQKIAETADDLRIMLQILREKLSEPRMVRGAFVDFGSFFDDKGRASEAFYLQGSAVVFVLEMDSPLLFASPQAGVGEAAKESVDPVWQRARQKVYSPQDPALRSAGGLPGEPERVDFAQFKEDLLKTLRHAANVRNIEPNESVILTIIAHDESGGWPAPAGAGGSFSSQGGTWFEGGSSSTSSASFGPSGGNTSADSQTYSRGSAAGRDGANRNRQSGPTPAAPTTVLTIQAKKADIDAFAKGELSFEQFQQRVKTFTY